MSKERESGYYWVRISDKWFIAEWHRGSSWWYTTGSHHIITDGDLDEIDETPIKRK